MCFLTTVLGGLLLLLDLLDSKYPSIQWRAADVIAVSLQNNSSKALILFFICVPNHLCFFSSLSGLCSGPRLLPAHPGTTGL
jgi:hypothetical protein